MKYKMKFAAAEKNKHQSHYQGQIIQNQYILRLAERVQLSNLIIALPPLSFREIDSIMYSILYAF